MVVFQTLKYGGALLNYTGLPTGVFLGFFVETEDQEAWVAQAIMSVPLALKGNFFVTGRPGLQFVCKFPLSHFFNIE